MSICLCVAYGCFALQWQVEYLATQTYATKPKINAVWPFTEKVCPPCASNA